VAGKVIGKMRDKVWIKNISPMKGELIKCG
jgi:hypothetical protein